MDHQRWEVVKYQAWDCSKELTSQSTISGILGSLVTVVVTLFITTLVKVVLDSIRNVFDFLDLD